MSAIRTALVPVLLGVSVAAMAPTHGAAQEGQQGQTIEVAVTNQADSGAHVYALQEGHMVPVGFLEAGASEALAVPPTLVDSGEAIRLVVDPVGSAEWYESEALSLESGRRAQLTIQADVERSTVSVRG